MRVLVLAVAVVLCAGSASNEPSSRAATRVVSKPPPTPEPAPKRTKYRYGDFPENAGPPVFKFEPDRFTGMAHVGVVGNIAPWTIVLINGLAMLDRSLPVGTAANVLVTFSLFGPLPRYARCHDIWLLADGRPVRVLGPNPYTDTVTEFGSHENFGVWLSRPEAARLLVAQVVEVRLCHDEFRFPSEVVHEMNRMGAAL